MKIGKTQPLKVKRKIPYGLILSDELDNEVLLPKKEIEDENIGDIIEVFVLKDSEDRIIATKKKPHLEVGELGFLDVASTTKIGAFLDNGLDKDVLLPFKEQNAPVSKNDKVFVYLYEDKTGRLAATTKIYKYLSDEAPYKKGNWLEGFVFQINNLGAFVAIDNQYLGLIHKEDINNDVQLNKPIKARVVERREDGKLRLSPIKQAYKEIMPDAVKILTALKKNNGYLPFNDKTSPEVIREEFNISKGAFKKALGHLLKRNMVVQTDEGIKVTRK